MPLIHYTIRDQYEECECHRCGTPLDAGDTAWTNLTCTHCGATVTARLKPGRRRTRCMRCATEARMSRLRHDDVQLRGTA